MKINNIDRGEFNVLVKGGKGGTPGDFPTTPSGKEPIGGEGGEDTGSDIDLRNRGMGATLTAEESEELQRALGVPVELPGADDAAKIIETAARHRDKLESNRGGIGGRGDGSLLRKAIDRLSLPKVDWKAELKRYIGTIMSKSETVFPARRHIHNDNYFTAQKHKHDAIKQVAIAVDVTGSVQGDFYEFIAEVAGIAYARKIKDIHVLPFAESVHDVTIVKDRKPVAKDFEHVKLGGGTENITAIKEYINKKMGGKVSFCVIITDGHLTTGLPPAPKEKWGKNTIWLVYNNPGFEKNYKFNNSWGKVIHVKFDKK